MGRYADPNSRRSLQAAAKAARLAAATHSPITTLPGKPAMVPNTGSALPVPPAWLSAEQADLFRLIVADLVSAKVPLKRIDGHAITMVTQCMDGVREASALAEDAKVEPVHRLTALRLKQQLGRDLIQWLPLIGGSPIARARIGLKDAPEKKQGPLAQLLAARQAKQG